MLDIPGSCLHLRINSMKITEWREKKIAGMCRMKSISMSLVDTFYLLVMITNMNMSDVY